LQLIREDHTSKVVGQSGVGKKILNLHRYVYWPKMQEYLALHIRGCILCCTNMPSNRKQGLYHPLLVPTQPRENISMDFVGGLPRTGKGHDYLFMLVDRFKNMCILIPCKKTIKEHEETKLFFE
jgi:hypothetical protein